MEKETNLEHYLHRLKGVVKEKYNSPRMIFDTIQAFMDPEIKHIREEYTADILDWMAQQYRETILNPKEKEYLASVIRPFRKEVKVIRKQEDPAGKEYIQICLEKDRMTLPREKDSMTFPSFEKGKMYKGMELEKRYTPEDLGL